MRASFRAESRGVHPVIAAALLSTPGAGSLAGLAFDLYGTHTVPILVSAGTMTIAMIFASLLPKTTTAVRPRPAVSTAS